MKQGESRKALGIIPARMASTRFPGKPLAEICGIPMVGHIYFRSARSRSLDAVYVATCDHEIEDYVSSIHGNVVMTSESHERASDRTAEALEKITRETGTHFDIVVMIQGDEPLVTPAIIDSLVEPMRRDSTLVLTNSMAPIEGEAEFADPNVVKVVCDRDHSALYFSREPIPSKKMFRGPVPMFKQLGIIAFRASFLMEYTRLPPTILEKIESVDMLRVLEHGYRIRMVMTDYKTCSVDTPEDLRYVEQTMKDDPLVRWYAR